ncbi:molecular chaperone DnaJ [Rhizophagus clarus]|uniref:Molecular chaperone DnaJ n=1 Tax=Rhizophagus clarus TaxID=94130 RepID=A0A8H3LF24_9GLOM|nr:molecular chaperone DnaJ [Rhizophagus clarus]
MVPNPAQYEYYKVLEISPTASSQEIKKAYKKLALKYHPDKHKQRLNNDTSMASINNQFILINEAYSVLAHEESRAQYDYLCSTGKTPNQELSGECGKVQLMHKLFREIMAKREQISELSESFESFAISMGWMMQTHENEDKLFGAFEKEISFIESNILEDADIGEQTSSYIADLSTHYLPEDDVVLIIENPQWILIEKEQLIHYHQLSEFAEFHMLLVKSIKIIVSPLMMACTYGTWGEQRINLLQRFTSLMTRYIQYLEFIQEKTKTSEGVESVIDKMSTQNIQSQLCLDHLLLANRFIGQFWL